MFPFSSFIHSVYRALNLHTDEDDNVTAQLTEIRQQLSTVLLCYAAANGYAEDIMQMVCTGVGINSGDYDGRTALHLASTVGNVSCVRALLSSRAAVDVEDRWGQTPLQVRCRVCTSGFCRRDC